MLTVASNPKRRRRRNPDGSFASASNPRRKRRTYRRQHNPAAVASNPAAVASNPRRHYRRRRNPFGIEKTTQQLYGVGLEEMAGGAAGLLGTSIVGEMINQNFNQGLAVIPSGQPRDIMYMLKRTWPHGLAAAGVYFAAKALGLKREVVAAVGVTGAAAALSKFLAASDVAPQIASEGSLRLGAGAGAGARRQLPPPGAASVALERTPDTVTVIP